MSELLSMTFSDLSKSLIGESEGREGRARGGNDRPPHGDAVIDVIEPLFGEPGTEIGRGGDVDPHERAGARREEMGCQGLGVVDIPSHHGPDDLAAPEWAKGGKALKSSGAVEHREAADRSETRDEVCPVRAISDAVELGDGWNIGGPRGADP